jgi:hypothetical protein
MASTVTNWVHDNGVVSEKDRITLEKAKRIERKQTKNGYRWIEINERNKIFVPCDKKGNPTKEGERKIQLFKNALGIK